MVNNFAYIAVNLKELNHIKVVLLLLASLSEKNPGSALVYLYTLNLNIVHYGSLELLGIFDPLSLYSFVVVPSPYKYVLIAIIISVFFFISRIQANQTGQRLQSLNIKYTKLVCSTLIRATETADIIAQHLPDVPRETCDLLREGSPIVPEPSSSHWRPAKRVSSSKPGSGCSNIGQGF